MTAIGGAETGIRGEDEAPVPIRVLRVGNSQDTFGTLDEALRSHIIAGQLLSGSCGRPVETAVRIAWPSPGFADVVERWMKRYQPDIVYLKVTDYWYGFESVPLRLERLLGRRVGAPVGRTGRKAASAPWLAFNPAFRALRALGQATIGGATYFEPEQVIEEVSRAVRRIVQQEDVVLVVDGPRGLMPMSGSRRRQAWTEERRLRIHHAMEALCQELHILHLGKDEPRYRTITDPLLGDRMHYGAEGHARLGREEGEIMLRAWDSSRRGVAVKKPRVAQV